MNKLRTVGLLSILNRRTYWLDQLLIKTEFRRWYTAAAVTRVKLTLTLCKVTRSVSNSVTTVTSREVTILHVQLSRALRWSTAEAECDWRALYSAVSRTCWAWSRDQLPLMLFPTSRLQLLALIRCVVLAVKWSEDHVQPMPVMCACKINIRLFRESIVFREIKILRSPRDISFNSVAHRCKSLLILLWRVDWKKQQTMLLKIPNILFFVSVNVTPCNDRYNEAWLVTTS